MGGELYTVFEYKGKQVWDAIHSAGLVNSFEEYGRMVPIEIGGQAFINMSALTMPGVMNGNGTIVGAGAIVVKDVAPDSIVADNPAKVIGTLLTIGFELRAVSKSPDAGGRNTLPKLAG